MPLTSIALPFEHHADPFPLNLGPRHPALQVQMPRDSPGDEFILVEVIILGPGVELPIEQREAVIFTLVVDEKRRPRVAEPDAVGGALDEAHPIKIDPGFVQLLGSVAL